MQTDPTNEKEEFEDDLKTFEQGSEKNKELQRLKTSQEKSIGEDLLEVDEKIEEKTD